MSFCDYCEKFLNKSEREAAFTGWLRERLVHVHGACLEAFLRRWRSF